MMKRYFFTLIFSLICGLSFAQSVDEKAIDKVVDDYNKAIVAKDSVSLKKLLADNCSMTDPGSSYDKKGIINVFCSGTYDVSKVTIAKRAFSQKQEKLQSVVTANIAVSVNQSDMSGSYISTYTFAKQNGAWVITSIDISNG